MKKSIQTPLGVYTDDEAGIEMIESYANQKVNEELELILSIEKETGIVPINALKHRLKELKQEQDEPNRKANWLRTKHNL